MKTMLFVLCCLLASCFSTQEEDPGFNPEKFAVRLVDGEKRIVLRTFSSIGAKYRHVTPMLALIQVDKDTTIGGQTGKIVNTTAWERREDGTSEYHWRQWVVVEGDTARIYEFKDTTISSMFYGLLKRNAWDTLLFSDRIAFAPFPLSAGMKWTIRDTADPLFIPELEREFLGMETIGFDGKSHRCGVFGQTFLMDTHAKSWISPIGMLKAEIDYGPASWTDSLGNILDTGTVRDDYRLLAINPSEARIAKEKADLAEKFVLIDP